MKAIPPVKAVMTPFPFWVDIDEPLARAREMMAKNALSHLPVVEHGAPAAVMASKSIIVSNASSPSRPFRGPPAGFRRWFVGLLPETGLHDQRRLGAQRGRQRGLRVTRLRLLSRHGCMM